MKKQTANPKTRILALTGCSLAWSLFGFILLLEGCSRDPLKLVEQAQTCWRAGDYQDAIRLNTQLYETDAAGKYASQALLNIGNIYYLNLRQIEKAIDAYQKVTTEFPQSPQAYEARGQLALIYENEIEDYSQAIIEYDKILEANNLDNRAEIQYRKANNYFRQGDYDLAWREFRHIEESGEGGPHLAGQVCLKLGNINQIRHQYDDAVGYFLKVIDSPCPECRRQAILSLADAYEALYDFEHAIETLQKLDQSPEDKQLVRREIARIKKKAARVNTTPHRF